MSDDEFYVACAIAAMQALIRKVPLADSDKGDNPEEVAYAICQSADRYAAMMCCLRRGRAAGTYPATN